MIEKRGHLDIKAASRLTGLSLYTIRSWENRYQAVVPARTKTGRRQYRYEDINKLKILQRLVTNGFRIGAIAELNLNDLETLHSTNTNPCQRQNINLTAEIHHLRKHLCDFDMNPFFHSLQRIRHLLPAQNFIFQILIPLIQDVNNSQKIGNLNIVQRNTFSLIIREQINHLTAKIYENNLGKKKISLCTPDPTIYEFRLLLAHSLCKITGHHTQYLGANIPSRALRETLGILKPDLLLVTCTQQAQKDYGHQLREFFDIIISAKHKPEIWVSGTGANIMTAYTQRQGIKIIKDFKELAFLLAKPSSVYHGTVGQ